MKTGVYSGQPKFTIEEVIESIKTLWIKDFGRLDSNSPDRDGYFVCGFVHEALRAACASGAVDTATCGVDDNGWHCLLFEQGKLDSPCKAGCVHARSSCEG